MGFGLTSVMDGDVAAPAADSTASQRQTRCNLIKRIVGGGVGLSQIFMCGGANRAFNAKMAQRAPRRGEIAEKRKIHRIYFTEMVASLRLVAVPIMRIKGASPVGALLGIIT